MEMVNPWVVFNIALIYRMLEVFLFGLLGFDKKPLVTRKMASMRKDCGQLAVPIGLARA